MEYQMTLKGKIIFIIMSVLMIFGILCMLFGVFSFNKSKAEEQFTGMYVEDSFSYVESESAADAIVSEQSTEGSWTEMDALVVASQYTDDPIYYPEDFSSSMVKSAAEDILGEQYEVTVERISEPPTKLWGIISPMDGFYEVVEYEDESLLNYEVVMSAILDRENFTCNFYEY